MVLTLEIVDKLKSLNLDFWVDKEEIDGGENIFGEVNKGLEECDTFLLVWSMATSKSHFIMEGELSTAFQSGKKIILCNVDGTLLPHF